MLFDTIVFFVYYFCMKIDLYVPKCDHPIFLKKTHQLVPCGHCVHCVSRVKNDWRTRLNLEVHNKPYQFLTLTMDDASVQDTSYRDVQLFLKRLRRFIDYHYGKKVKYFGSFERGEKTHRPHFHLLLIGFRFSLDIGKHLKMTRDQFLATIWKKGFVKVEDVSSDKAIDYVVGYVLKKALDFDQKKMTISRLEYNKINKYSKSDVEAGFVRSAYYFMSQGIGKDYIVKNEEKVLKKRYFVFGQYKSAVPRYYVKYFKDKYDIDFYSDVKNEPSQKDIDMFNYWLENVYNPLDLSSRRENLGLNNLNIMFKNYKIKKYKNMALSIKDRLRIRS